jgi:mono/diheme cytochrome c family protein
MPPEKAPQFGFTAAERADLQAFTRTARDSLFRGSPAEFAERQTRLLNCNACHGQVEGFPALEILGGKLKPEWSAKLIAGEIAYKPRPETHPRGEPWMEARMPGGFKARAQLLAEGLAALHGYGPKTSLEPPIDEELAKLGQKLVGKDGGFSCVSCHGVAGLAATDVFDSEGINLAYSYERLLRDYYYRWMRNPLAIDSQTKMPAYFEEGKSPLTEILDGDAEKQITAMWHYMRLGQKMPVPNVGEAP